MIEHPTYEDPSSEEDPTLEHPTDAVRAWRDARHRNNTPRPAPYQPPPDDRPTLPPTTTAAVSGEDHQS